MDTKYKFCYLSNSEHNKSIIGRLLYIYTSKGELNLLEKCLTFKNKYLEFMINYTDIQYIEIGNYCRLAKPLKLEFVSIIYGNDLRKETLLFTPTNSWATPVWKTNVQVHELYNYLSSQCKNLNMPNKPMHRRRRRD